MNGTELAHSVFGEIDALGANEHAVSLSIGHSAVAHVGMSERLIALDGQDVKIAAIGYVCTAPEYRGHWFMHMLMGIAHDEACRLGCVFAMLWTGHVGLYERLGYHHPPNLDTVWRVKELADTQWPEIATVELRGTW